MLVCKFYVSSVHRSAPHDHPHVCALVKLEPVRSHGGDASTRLPENESWSAHTPAGSIELTITNPTALEELQPGKSYIVSFQEAY